MRKTTLDMTAGDPVSLLVRFSLPTLAGNLLHQVYSITDSIIVGRYLGQSAFAAVGCTMPIILLIASLLIGVNVGVGILLSQCFGRHDMGEMRRTFANSLYFGLGLSLVVAAIGPAISIPILRWMGTPEGPLQDAASYLRINFITTICPMLYYLFSCAFRGMGDSRTVLYCLIVSVVGNIGLDILFVAVWGWGVAGSAWATSLAQAASAIFAAILLWFKYPSMRLRRDDLRPNGVMLTGIAKLATPIAVQSAFNNLGNMVAQSAVNSFGEAVMAAYTAGSRLGTLSLMPMETVAGSLSIYAGQNWGAKKLGRIQEGVRACLKINLILSAVLGVVLALGSGTLPQLFLEEPTAEVISAARTYLLIAAVPGILAGIMHTYQQILRGIGKPTPAMAGGLTQLGVKIAVIAIGAWGMHSLEVIWVAWPASFLAGTVLPFLYYRSWQRKAD